MIHVGAWSLAFSGTVRCDSVFRAKAQAPIKHPIAINLPVLRSSFDPGFRQWIQDSLAGRTPHIDRIGVSFPRGNQAGTYVLSRWQPFMR